MQRFKQKTRPAVLVTAVAVALGAGFGLLPWRLAPADSPDGTVSAAERKDVAPAVAEFGDYTISVRATTEITGGHQLAWDLPNLYDNDNVVTREFSDPSGRGGGRAAAGGSAGTFTAPNYALAIHVAGLYGDFLVKLESAEAQDGTGKIHRPVDSGERFRMTVPSFESQHPACAGAYFRFDDPRTAFARLHGTILLVPVKLEETVFASPELQTGARRQLDGRTVILDALNRHDGDISVSVAIIVPGPGRNVRGPGAFREFTSQLRSLQKAITITLVDDAGNQHRPRAARGGSGGSSAGGRDATINLNCRFAPLAGDIAVKEVRVRLVQPKGEPRRVPFQLRDVALL